MFDVKNFVIIQFFFLYIEQKIHFGRNIIEILFLLFGVTLPHNGCCFNLAYIKYVHYGLCIYFLTDQGPGPSEHFMSFCFFNDSHRGVEMNTLFDIISYHNDIIKGKF